MIETINPSNPLGVKGCGEAGAIAAPAALMNAITDAIGRDMNMPATPERVWRAIHTPALAAE
jgi:carbon-monoxide dehydrogenase large subunit